MAFIAQRPVRLSGKEYEPGDPVPDEVAAEGAGATMLVALGLVTMVPDAAVAGIRAGSEAATEVFDPAQHTVHDVLDYLDANPDQTERVADAERHGRNRSTLLGHIEDRLAEAEAAPDESGDDKEEG